MVTLVVALLAGTGVGAGLLLMAMGTGMLPGGGRGSVEPVGPANAPDGLVPVNSVNTTGGVGAGLGAASSADATGIGHSGDRDWWADPLSALAAWVNTAAPAAVLLGGRWRLRFGLSAGVAVVLLAVTGWPVLAVLGAFMGYLWPTFQDTGRHRQASAARTEAVAAWAEQLRDTIAASSGLQDAIAVTASSAPAAIRPELLELAAGMRRNPLPHELERFAQRLDDPVADQVAVALGLAAEHRGQNLTGILTDIAQAARNESAMRMRVETSRSQAYGDARAVAVVVAVMFGFLLATSRQYLQPFDSLGGQLVLAMVALAWAAAVWALVNLSVLRRPPRIVAIGHYHPGPAHHQLARPANNRARGSASGGSGRSTGHPGSDGNGHPGSGDNGHPSSDGNGRASTGGTGHITGSQVEGDGGQSW